MRIRLYSVSTRKQLSPLVEAYFNTIKKKLSNFSTENCRKYVSQFIKTPLNEDLLRIIIAETLIDLDNELDSYDSTD